MLESRSSVLAMRQQHHHILILLPWLRVFRIRLGGRSSLRRRRSGRNGGAATGSGILRVRDVVDIIATAVGNVVRVVHLDKENAIFPLSTNGVELASIAFEYRKRTAKRETLFLRIEL